MVARPATRQALPVDGGPLEALALVVHALAGADLTEAADRHPSAARAFGLDALRVGGAVDVDAGRRITAAVADILDRAVGIAAAAVVDFDRRRYLARRRRRTHRRRRPRHGHC